MARNPVANPTYPGPKSLDSTIYGSRSDRKAITLSRCTDQGSDVTLDHGLLQSLHVHGQLGRAVGISDLLLADGILMGSQWFGHHGSGDHAESEWAGKYTFLTFVRISYSASSALYVIFGIVVLLRD